MKYFVKLILIPIIRRCEHPYEKIKIDDNRWYQTGNHTIIRNHQNM